MPSMYWCVHLSSLLLCIFIAASISQVQSGLVPLSPVSALVLRRPSTLISIINRDRQGLLLQTSIHGHNTAGESSLSCSCPCRSLARSFCGWCACVCKQVHSAERRRRRPTTHPKQEVVAGGEDRSSPCVCPRTLSYTQQQHRTTRTDGVQSVSLSLRFGRGRCFDTHASFAHNINLAWLAVLGQGGQEVWTGKLLKRQVLKSEVRRHCKNITNIVKLVERVNKSVRKDLFIISQTPTK